MDNLGIQIISCNIQTITDEKDLINQLGQDNMSQIQKDASIAKANAERDIAIATAAAHKEATAAEVEAGKQIAEKNNELAIRQAELKIVEDTKRAEADAAFAIQEQIQRKTIQTEAVNVQIAETERNAELKEKEVAVKEQELAATIKKQADADKYKAERAAEASLIQRQKEADAILYEQQKQADAIKAKGIAEAEAIKVKGEAEAEAIAAKGKAEAEAMDKKAEAYQKYNGAAMAEMMIKIMPQMAAEIAKPLSAIDKINIYGTDGDSTGASQISGNMPVVMKQVFDTMSEATGVDFTEIMRAGTYDAKVNRNVNLQGIPDTVKVVDDTTRKNSSSVTATPEPPKKAKKTVKTENTEVTE